MTIGSRELQFITHWGTPNITTAYSTDKVALFSGILVVSFREFDQAGRSFVFPLQHRWILIRAAGCNWNNYDSVAFI